MIFIFSSGACYKFAAGQQIPALKPVMDNYIENHFAGALSYR